MFWLLSTRSFPPGEWSYNQTEGIGHKFGSNSELGALIAQVLSFRKSNKISGANYNQVYEDVIRYTCQRLKNSSQWCFDTDRPPGDFIPDMSKGCGGCGAVMNS